MQIHKGLRQLLVSFVIVLCSLSVGVTGLMSTEGFGFWKAFYLSVIIFSTVGMNEVGHLTEASQIFVSFYVILNLGVFAYFVSVITRYLFEGELKEILQNYMVNRVADQMKGHTIICGYGRNGIKACEELFSAGVPFALIEKNAQVVGQTYAKAKHVYLVQGDATSDEVLISAGIERASALITTLPNDADNVFVVLTARELSPSIRIVARASEMSSVSKLHRAGANHVVMPDAIGGLHMANLITKPEVIEFLEVLNGVETDMRLDELKYEHMAENLQKLSIREMKVREMTGATILGFKKGGIKFIFNPHPDTVFGNGDILIVLGTEQELKRFMKTCAKA